MIFGSGLQQVLGGTEDFRVFSDTEVFADSFIYWNGFEVEGGKAITVSSGEWNTMDYLFVGTCRIDSQFTLEVSGNIFVEQINVRNKLKTNRIEPLINEDGHNQPSREKHYENVRTTSDLIYTTNVMMDHNYLIHSVKLKIYQIPQTIL